MSRTTSENLAILGLNAGATDEDIKKAYRRLATQYHPDKNPDSAEQFQKIKTAYEELTRPRTTAEMAEYVPPPPRTWQNTVKRAQEFLECAQFKNNETEIQHWNHVLEIAQAALESSDTESETQVIEPYGFDFGNIQFEEFRRDFAHDVVRVNGDATRPYLEWLETRKSNALSSDLLYFNTPYFQRCILIAECIATEITETNLTRIKSLAEGLDPIQAEELNVLFLLALRTNNLTLIEFFLKELHIDINNLITVSYEANNFKQYFLISPLHFAILDDVTLKTILFLLDNAADPDLEMRLPCVLGLKSASPLLLAVKAKSNLLESYGFSLTQCEYSEKNRHIDVLVLALLQHGADASALSKVQKSFYEPNYLYCLIGTKYPFTDNPILQPFYSYANVYSRILVEAFRGLYQTITDYTDIAFGNPTVTTQELNFYFNQRQQQAMQYLSSIQQLLADDHHLNTAIGKDKIQVEDVINLRYYLPFIAKIEDPRSKREKKLAKDSRAHCNGLIKCRMAFDKVIVLMKANQSGFEKYLTQACKHDKALFHDLIVNLLTQKGAYREFNLSEMPGLARKICDLEIVRNTAKEEALTLLAKISKHNEKAFIKNYLKPEHKTLVMIESIKDSSTKKDLLNAYEKLIHLRKEQIQALAQVIAQTKEMQSTKTTRIFSWHSSFWKTVGNYHQDIKQSLAILDKKIRAIPQSRSILSPYQPILKNMIFFNTYLGEAITGEKPHSFNRIAYCMSFIASMAIHYDPNKKDLLTIELLKNLYNLKGLLLAEVHSQSYLKNLFNCAMTSRLADHVLTEINKIETMLRKTRQSAEQKIQLGDTNLNISNIDVDHDPDILAKRQELVELDNHYSNAWRRFKTAFFSNKQAVNEKIDPSIIAKREHCVSMLGSSTLFAREINQPTVALRENQQYLPT